MNDCILGKEDQFFKFIGKLTHLGIEDLTQEIFLENSSAHVEFLENKTAKVTAGIYFLSITEIVNGVQQIETGSLFIVND